MYFQIQQIQQINLQNPSYPLSKPLRAYFITATSPLKNSAYFTGSSQPTQLDPSQPNPIKDPTQPNSQLDGTPGKMSVVSAGDVSMMGSQVGTPNLKGLTGTPVPEIGTPNAKNADAMSQANVSQVGTPNLNNSIMNQSMGMDQFVLNSSIGGDPNMATPGSAGGDPNMATPNLGDFNATPGSAPYTDLGAEARRASQHVNGDGAEGIDKNREDDLWYWLDPYSERDEDLQSASDEKMKLMEAKVSPWGCQAPNVHDRNTLDISQEEMTNRLNQFMSNTFREAIEAGRTECSDIAIGRLAALHGEDT